MQPLIGYILKNKEWLFSGVGVFALSGMLVLLRRMFSQRAPQLPTYPPGILSEGERHDPTEPLRSKRATNQDAAPEDVPKEWQTIIPPQSKYKFVSEKKDAIPLGLQSFSFEYGPTGHAYPLVLKKAMVRAEVEFTCRVNNPYKALFGANDYALNILPPRFLTQARNILEAYSLSQLRESRLEASRAIEAAMAPQFMELGVRLESVTIGALEQIGPS
jgi:SPFH domain / Band 7 family